MEKQITTKQVAMLIFIMGMSIKIFMLPVLLLKMGGRDSYFTVIIALALEIICLFAMLMALKLSPNKNFYQLLESAFTKWCARLITLIFALYYFLKLLLVVSDIRVFFTVSIYENLPWAIFVIPLLALLCALSVSGLTNLARTVEIFTPIIIIAVALMGCLLSSGINFKNLLPILDNGFGGITNSLAKYPLWYGDFSAFLIFLGRIKRTKNTTLVGMISAAISAIIVFGFSLVIFAAYANVADILQYGASITNITRITLSGLSLGRIDLLLFCVWMISVFIKASILFCTVVFSAQSVFNAQNKRKVSICLAVVMYIIIVFLAPNEVKFRTFCLSMNIPTLIIQYSIPLLIFISAVITRVKEEKQKKVCLYE